MSYGKLRQNISFSLNHLTSLGFPYVAASYNQSYD